VNWQCECVKIWWIDNVMIIRISEIYCILFYQSFFEYFERFLTISPVHCEEPIFNTFFNDWMTNGFKNIHNHNEFTNIWKTKTAGNKWNIILTFLWSIDWFAYITWIHSLICLSYFCNTIQLLNDAKMEIWTDNIYWCHIY
jgi:hypothetical protein